MDWGAFLTTNEGVPWWTPKTTPLSFVRKESVRLDEWGRGARIETRISTAQPCLAFMCAHTSDIWHAPYGDLGGGGGQWVIDVKLSAAKASVLCEIYLFTLVYPQPVPDWGMAVWDEAGQCVITSDTKPLVIEGEDSTARRQGKILNGKKAILMQRTGWYLSRYDHEDARNRFSDTSFSTAFNGRNTQLLTGAVDIETNVIIGQDQWDLTSPYIDCALYD
ncbi:hypothetical protein ID856_14550 [Xenorhabdus sp. 18]|uniref:hypothetical protein n=1 Tax=Xenorhabdus doucetiae TaxID=351671 RepID=UPI0019887BFF|nr:hypothetical protein [Xenorhabdus sp. 18]MBD2797746.1 hypothetical protein [Xenorhabdus sp. 18]